MSARPTRRPEPGGRATPRAESLTDRLRLRQWRRADEIAMDADQLPIQR